MLATVNASAFMPYAAAAGASAGAWMLIGLPLAAVLVLAAAFAWRPNVLLAFAVFAALTGFFGVRAVAGLTQGLPTPGEITGWVTLVDDPRPLGHTGVRVTVRYQGKRLEARAHGPAAARLDDALAGERVRVTATVREATGDWYRWRHVVARMTVASVHDKAPASPLAGFANRVRRLLARGARGMSADHRSLFSGMVYGDDREQSYRLADDFRAAGLGHLLVVSGQNVAFVLALASPVVDRLRPGGRLVALVALLSVFAVLTRFEPSVLRAVGMAAAAVTSAALGHPERGRRTLAWAIAAVLVIDPFLVRMLAFQLSVFATAGLLWITPALTEALPGPRPLRLAVATTAGAQLAVTPLLIVAFGTVPLASLPANVLVGPAAGPVMMWGLTAGLFAGVAGGWVAWAVHLPTSALLWWVRRVAETAAALPPAVLGAAGATAVIVGVAMLLGAPRLASSATLAALLGHRVAGRGSLIRSVGVAMVLAAFAHSVSGAAAPSPGWSEVRGASVLSHPDGVVVVLDQPGSPRRLLEGLRLAGVRRADLIVAADGDAADAHAVLALTERYRGAAVIAPPLHRVPRARTVAAGAVLRIGALRVDVVADTPSLAVEIASAPLR